MQSTKSPQTSPSPPIQRESAPTSGFRLNRKRKAPGSREISGISTAGKKQKTEITTSNADQWFECLDCRTVKTVNTRMTMTLRSADKVQKAIKNTAGSLKESAVLTTYPAQYSEIHKLDDGKFVGHQRLIKRDDGNDWGWGHNLWSKSAGKWTSTDFSDERNGSTVDVLDKTRFITKDGGSVYSLWQQSDSGRGSLVSSRLEGVVGDKRSNVLHILGDGKTIFMLTGENKGSLWEVEGDSASCQTKVVLPFGGGNTRVLTDMDGSLFCYQYQKQFTNDRKLVSSDRGHVFRYDSDNNNWTNAFPGSNVPCVISGLGKQLEAVVLDGAQEQKIVKVQSPVTKEWITLATYKKAKDIDVKQLSANSYLCQSFNSDDTPSVPMYCSWNGTDWNYQNLGSEKPELPVMLSSCIQLEDGRIFTVEGKHHYKERSKILKVWTEEKGIWSVSQSSVLDTSGDDTQTCLTKEVKSGVVAMSLSEQGEIRLFDLNQSTSAEPVL